MFSLLLPPWILWVSTLLQPRAQLLLPPQQSGRGSLLPQTSAPGTQGVSRPGHLLPGHLWENTSSPGSDVPHKPESSTQTSGSGDTVTDSARTCRLPRGPCASSVQGSQARHSGRCRAETVPERGKHRRSRPHPRDADPPARWMPQAAACQGTSPREECASGKRNADFHSHSQRPSWHHISSSRASAGHAMRHADPVPQKRTLETCMVQVTTVTQINVIKNFFNKKLKRGTRICFFGKNAPRVQAPPSCTHTCCV